jgi:hypothetical protein
MKFNVCKLAVEILGGQPRQASRRRQGNADALMPVHGSARATKTSPVLGSVAPAAAAVAGQTGTSRTARAVEYGGCAA